MKKQFKLLAVAVGGALIASCSTLKISTDYDKSADFTSKKTFAIYKNEIGKSTLSPLNLDRITNAVKSELKSKGYSEVASAPDFWVNINTVVKDKKYVTANTDYFGYGGAYRPYGYWGGGMGMASSTTSFNVDDYKDGSVIVDMIDAASKKMFWEGVANDEVDGEIKNPDAKVADAVAKLLASFPSVGTEPAAK